MEHLATYTLIRLSLKVYKDDIKFKSEETKNINHRKAKN